MTTLKTIKEYFDNMEILTEEEEAISEMLDNEIEKRKKLLKKIDLIIKDCEEEGQGYTIELLEELKELI